MVNSAVFLFKMYTINILIATTYTWDLNYFGISENYYISAIATYRSRTFLALSRTVCHNNITNPTLVEVPWNGNYKQPAHNIKYIRPKLLDLQKWGDCKYIQDAVSLDIEPKKPRLWILDKGNEYCEPKIFSYNIIYNSLLEISKLKNIPRDKLSVIKIDPQPLDSGYRMYIGNAGENTLLVFSSDDLKWRTIVLKEPNTLISGSINVDFLALSKTEPLLYATAIDSLNLFSIELKDIRNIDGPSSFEVDENSQIEVNISLVGQKLGYSSGLETDYQSGLSYFIIRDYAVVRWMMGLPIQAEYHNVLAQSYQQLPYVTELFADQQLGLWALVNPLPPDQCNASHGSSTNYIPKLYTRTVKILSYNRLLEDMV